MSIVYNDIYLIKMSKARKSFANYLNAANIQEHIGISVPQLVADRNRDKIYILTPIGAVSFGTHM
jgi:hypothetical protein